MATETLINVGIRRNFTVGARNFEDSGTVLYHATREGLNWNGVTYHKGDSIAFDAPGGTSYTTATIEKLRFFWNHGWIHPIA